MALPYNPGMAPLSPPPSATGASEPVPFELGISGLPARLTRLARGMVYALAVGQQSLRLTLIGNALSRALAIGGTAAVLTPQEPMVFLRKLTLNGLALEPFLKAGTLKVHGLGAQGAATRQAPQRRLLQELQGLELPRRSLVVIDHADERFSLGDAAAARLAAQALQDWIEQHEHTLILTFGTTADQPDHSTHVQTLAQVGEAFAGFATSREHGAEAVLDVHHWFGALGAVQRVSLILSIDERGVLRARPAVEQSNIDPEQELQLATRAAIADFARDAAGWVQAGSMLEAVDKARRMVGGTVILHFDPESSVRELAQAIAVLRSQPRPQLRIIVRECGARLRMPQVAALMRLGMNMIIPQEVAGLSAQAMAESLRGTLSSRHYDGDVDRLMTSVDIDLPSQVVTVGEFRRQVVDLLARAQELEVPVCLVRFSAVSPQAMRAVLGALSRGRNCLFTQHDGGGWMLLYGCLPERAAGVLARLLGARYENLLEDFQLVGEQGEIQRVLGLLRHAAENLSDTVFEDTVVRAEYESAGGEKA